MFENIVDQFKRKNIIIIGDVMLDKYLIGDSNRISPEAPVAVVKIKEELFNPGGAANVAMNIASLGANAVLVGYLGNDNDAKKLIQKLDEKNVTHHLKKDPSLKTISKVRVVSLAQQLVRIDYESNYFDICKKHTLKFLEENIQKVDAIIISDYAKGSLSNIHEIINFCNSFNKPIIVDPKGNDFKKYKNSTLLTPNLIGSS